MIGIELEEAVELLIKNCNKIKDIVRVDILESEGHILADDIVAGINNPPFNRSPLDGFSFDYQITKGAAENNPVIVNVESEVMAGDYLEKISSSQNAVRIMTGAPIPAGCNAVIRQEDVVYDEESKKVKIFKELQEYENFCFEGEDYKIGDILLRVGERLSPAHIGVLASLGKTKVKVFRKPIVGLLCTGDEIVLPGRELSPGKIYNSNLYSLASKLKKCGVKVKIYPPIDDDVAKVTELIKSEIKEIDILITTGGVSVGKKDILHDVIRELPAERLFWKINLKPGTPVLASLYKNKLVISLSGNPFAAIINYELLVKPVLNKLSNGMVCNNRQINAILKEEFSKKSNKRRVVRAKYENGKISFNTNKHSSGQLSSMIGKNALVDIEAGSPQLKKGDSVKVLIIGE